MTDLVCEHCGRLRDEKQIQSQLRRAIHLMGAALAVVQAAEWWRETHGNWQTGAVARELRDSVDAYRKAKETINAEHNG